MKQQLTINKYNYEILQKDKHNKENSHNFYRLVAYILNYFY